jgi:hypothetical protein
MATTVVLLIVLHALVAAASAQQLPPLARPGCRDRCGDIMVPYPFGIGTGCYRVDDNWRWGSFQLECDDSDPSHPRLITFYFNYRIASISLMAGEATAYLNATRSCYDSRGKSIKSMSSSMSMPLIGTPYLFSNTKNVLIALGCPTLGYFTDGSGQYVSGCMSVCRNSQYYLLPGECTGVGCCQSAIPKGLDYFDPQQSNNPNPQNSSAFANASMPCHYVFLFQTERFTEWFVDIDEVSFNRTGDFEVPIVLDWAIGRRNVANCSDARRNPTDYACRSDRSYCINATDGVGYRCNCSTGFHGNPYLDDGCTGTRIDTSFIAVFCWYIGDRFCLGNNEFCFPK